jgi:signal transduction histidine kinase/AraC-like DNA-binding protein
MEIKVTMNMLPDLLASSALLTLSIYHIMIFWGRRKDKDELYNVYFAVFVFSAAVFLISQYFQPQYFLYHFKPHWLNVKNIEMFSVWWLFYSGMRFFNLLINVPKKFNIYFKFLIITVTLNFISTFTSNLISHEFYMTYIIFPILFIVVTNVILIYSIYGYWLYKEKQYKDKFVLLIFFGFIFITFNILIYRTVEILHYPSVLILNHYFTAVMLYIFAYALSVKFNKEHLELKELKISLEKKVVERTNELQNANLILENKNIEIEKQKQEIIAINAELSHRAEELKELDTIKSRFFTNISHEFRTPLTLIIGPLESLMQKSNSKVHFYEYELMLKQAKRLLSLINQLLELSKLQKSMLNLQLTFDNINNYIRTLASAYTSFAGELNIKLIIKEECDNVEIWFDKDKIEKIVTNLITNALKFTESGGQVEIVMKKNEDSKFFDIAVRDNGIGIGADQLAHIFDPFYQADPASNSKIEGSGIGLALVKELCHLHKGEVRVSSILLKGTEFVVSIPTQKEVYQAKDFSNTQFKIDNPSLEIERDSDRYKIVSQKLNKDKVLILLVDDNNDMRTFIRTNLEPDYQIIEAVDGAEGLKVATENVPDLIVADIMMPIMNGIELARYLKSNELTSHIPLILLTAKASDASKLEGLETKADDYITKPFNLEELKIRIHNLIENRILLRDKFSKIIVINPTEIESDSIDERFLQKALQIVEKYIGEPEFNIEIFSSELNLSRTQVHRKLTALTGQSATEFIRNIRLKRAAQLLLKKAGSISEIAFETGFNNLSYFTKTFKEQFGVSPSEYIDKEKS